MLSGENRRRASGTGRAHRLSIRSTPEIRYGSNGFRALTCVEVPLRPHSIFTPEARPTPCGECFLWRQEEAERSTALLLEARGKQSTAHSRQQDQKTTISARDSVRCGVQPGRHTAFGMTAGGSEASTMAHCALGQGHGPVLPDLGVPEQKEIETRPQRNCTGAEDSLHQPAREGLYCRGRRVLRKQIQTVPCRPHQGLFRGA